MATMKTALVTGATRGLGLALARHLVADGWNVVIDGRGRDALESAVAELTANGRGAVVGIAGDVADAAHRTALVDAAARLGGLDLLVNNASILGPSPQPNLAEYPLDRLREVYEVNLVAPLALIQEALPALRSAHGTIVN